MTILIVGEESLINLEIDKILKLEKNYSQIKYDSLTPCDKIIEELNTIDMFYDKKIVIVKDFLNIKEQDILQKYIEKSKDNNILILTTSSLDERRKIVKTLKEKAKIIDTKNTNIDTFIKESFKDYEIDYQIINMLKEYTNNNYQKIENEINKLKMLKLDEKKITKEDIKEVTLKDFDTNIFDFLKAINNKNKKEALNIYYKLSQNKEDEIKIIGALANNYRLLYKIKVLSNTTLDNDIMTKCNIKNPYRLKILKQESYNYSEKYLLNMLKKLSELDIKIKSGQTDKKLGMELFLTSI